MRPWWALLGLFALAIGACRTHTVDDCRPTCDASDREFFAGCVANGSDDPCEPGNRRCCALAADCLGDLDDQTVVTSLTDCVAVTEDTCWHPCDAMDMTLYQGCLVGGSAAGCAPADESCCALAANCLGDIDVDVNISADGCCSTDDECPSGLTCDPMTWTCAGAPSGCGDGMMSATEECDDHNTTTESCMYGQMSCQVCDASCHLVAGVARYCGDGNVDLTDGEQCDPPGTAGCDANCHSGTSSCTDRIANGNETDVDCGGTDCPPCVSGQGCIVATDCSASLAMCIRDTASCATGGYCIETTTCDDGNDCTADDCIGATGGCQNTAIDHDADGHFPQMPGCGDDCDDGHANVFTGAPELCDGIDNDCDEFVDEACT